MCARHPEAPAARECASCGVPMCPTCWQTDVAGEPTCDACVVHLRERSPIALPALMSAYLVVLAELLLRWFLRSPTGASFLRWVAYFVIGVAAFFLYAKIKSRRVDPLVAPRDPDADVPTRPAGPLPSGPFRTPARQPQRVLDAIEVATTPPVSGDVASLLAMSALGVALVGVPFFVEGSTVERVVAATLTMALPLSLGLAWIFYRGARVADDHVFRAEARSFVAARDAEYSPWKLPAYAFALGGITGPQGIIVGALLAALVGALVGIGFVIGEIVVPLVFIAGYVYFQAAFRFAANHPHGARDSAPKSLALGLAYGALFSIPGAGIIAAAFALFSM